MIEVAIKMVIFLELAFIAMTVVNNSMNGRGLSLYGYKPFIIMLCENILESLLMIPRFILRILASILQVPISIVWNMIPGLSRLFSEPRLL